MLLSTIIDVASGTVERPDFTVENSLVRSFTIAALGQLHRMQNFARDVAELSTPITDPTAFKYSVTLPVRFRSIVDIAIVGNDTTLFQDFVRAYARRVPTQYCGVAEPYYFYLLGTELQITLAPIASADELIVSYLTLPDVSVSPTSGLWETDSWIAEQYPELVGFKLAQYFGAITSDDEATKAVTALATEQEYGLLNDSDIITPKY